MARSRKRSRSSMKGGRRRSRSRSRNRNSSSRGIRYGANGLPLPSTLARRHLGIVMADHKGNLKELDENRSGNLTWVKAQVKELTQKRADFFYNQIDNNLDDEDKIRDILEKVLKQVQPKVTQSVS